MFYGLRSGKERLSKLVMNNGSKISDEQFLSVLRENAGLFSRTAKAIESQFGIKYSRQAVRARAESFPEEVKDIDDENLDVAEEGLHTLMKSSNEPVKLASIKLYLTTRGKKRGYVERQEIENSGNVVIQWAEEKTYATEPKAD
jgi:hypothetical protein